MARRVLLLALTLIAVTADQVFVTVDEQMNTAISTERIPGACSASLAQEEGWHVLRVQGNTSQPAVLQSFAAGVAEGYLTGSLMRDHWWNLMSVLISNTTTQLPEQLEEFLLDQWDFAKNLARSDSSPYGQQLALLIQQMEGLVHGYSLSGAEPLGLADILFLSGNGDIPNIMGYLNVSYRPDYSKMSRDEMDSVFASRSRCSALIRPTADLTALYAGHATWWNWGTMLRVYKHYDVPTYLPAARRLSFSSYPGVLASSDDFYIAGGTKLVMLQTTNEVFDPSVYENVHRDALLSWQRIRLGFALADSGADWVDVILNHTTGTYANQYMLLDYKRFIPGKALLPGLLTVAEELPGMHESADLTSVLEMGYFGSYNVPRFPKIYDAMGYSEIVKQQGVEYSYQLAPRAKIFRRDAPNVHSLDQFRDLMRSNNYKTDPFSKPADGPPRATWAVCSRGDLLEEAPGPFGCIDAKVLDHTMVEPMVAFAVAGPTRGTNASQALPEFSWGEMHGKFDTQRHVGQPAAFDNDFVEMKPVF